MALVICPECGKQVSDMAASCPGCGYPLELLRRPGSNSPAMVPTGQTELERLTEEIYSKNPQNKAKAVKELHLAAGVSFADAKKIMDEKFQQRSAAGVIQKVAEKEKREADRDIRRAAKSKVVSCPKCGSVSISYQEGSGGGFLRRAAHKGYAVCLSCGERWDI